MGGGGGESQNQCYSKLPYLFSPQSRRLNFIFLALSFGRIEAHRLLAEIGLLGVRTAQFEKGNGERNKQF